ncbi:MAG: dihydrofolate reductase family protein [Spirochaetales bacterium]|nr:dihydrofolate reductase family protein [Spirochaetales bacterium]
MVKEYPKIKYDYDKILLDKIFEHDEVASYPNTAVQTEDSLRVFGNLSFPDFPENRVYTMASFVTSIDGKIAYLDNPAGPVVAQANAMDPDGATADFWILNLMRASADVCFAGAGTLCKEPDGLVCLFDQGLEDARVAAGKNPAPWVVICSLTGDDIPFGDSLLRNQPVMINSTVKGLNSIKRGLQQDHYVIGPYAHVDDIDDQKIINEFLHEKGSKTPVIISGDETGPNAHVVMKILKLMGMDTAIVESPSFCHSLMGDGLLDEITLNYSCVYIGGKAVGLGHGMAPYTSKVHPHTEMLSIHSHGPSFFYFRHKMVYGRTPEGYLGSIY